MTPMQKPTYDVATPLDVDYLEVFAQATDEDRAHWDRARAYGREVLERIDGHWDRAEYPLDLVARAGELDLLTDGLEVPGHAVMSPLAAGLVAMEISRADGSMAAAAAVHAPELSASVKASTAGWYQSPGRSQTCSTVRARHCSRRVAAQASRI